jgi:hypothetical protein
MNVIITIKIHVDFAYPRLFAQRKAQLTKKMQLRVMQIIHGNGGKKGRAP